MKCDWKFIKTWSFVEGLLPYSTNVGFQVIIAFLSKSLHHNSKICHYFYKQTQKWGSVFKKKKNFMFMSQYLDKQIWLSSHTVPCTTLKWKVRYKSRKFMEIMVFCLFCGYRSLEAWGKNTQKVLISKHKMRLAPFFTFSFIEAWDVPDIQYYKQ